MFTKPRQPRQINLRLCALLWLWACHSEGPPPHATTIRIAAAADLSRAFAELGPVFERESGYAVSLSFGSTGLLAKQLREGAPYDVFAAANSTYVDEIVAAGVCDGATKLPYAQGRIALWTRRDTVPKPSSLEDLRDPRFKRIAIANPEHAPYGQAAREALQDVELWSTLAPRLVYGENVLQALQLAETGNAEAAIVALALVSDDRQNPWLLIAPHHHRAIDQSLVVCHVGANRSGGQAFARFVGSRAGRELMRRHGFLLPGEELAAQP